MGQPCRYLAWLYSISLIYQGLSFATLTARIICSRISHFPKDRPEGCFSSPLVLQLTATATFYFCFHFPFCILQKTFQCAFSYFSQTFSHPHFYLPDQDAFLVLFFQRLFHNFRQLLCYQVYLFNVIFHFEPRVGGFVSCLLSYLRLPFPDNLCVHTRESVRPPIRRSFFCQYGYNHDYFLYYEFPCTQ